MRSRKKGSLSLSINAIVVLVLAISMLGLGLGFTKSMFAKFGSKLDVPPPNIPATEEEPIVLPADTVKGKIGKTLTFGVNIYNANTAAESITPTLTCGTSITGQGTLGNIPAQSYSGFKFLIGTAPTTATTEICTISAPFSVGGTITKQIIIEFT